MADGTEPSGTTERRLSDRQRWSVLRVAGLAALLAVATPTYYVLGAALPDLVGLLPAAVPHGLTATGLFVVFPATFLYATHLEGIEDGSTEGIEYGVDDRWERRNL